MTAPEPAAPRQVLAMVEGVWTCAWCAAVLTVGMIKHRQGCAWIAEIMTTGREVKLLPAENMALTVARAQVKRGENPPINTTTVLVMALDRLTGGEDWTAGGAGQAPEGEA